MITITKPTCTHEQALKLAYEELERIRGTSVENVFRSSILVPINRGGSRDHVRVPTKKITSIEIHRNLSITIAEFESDEGIFRGFVIDLSELMPRELFERNHPERVLTRDVRSLIEYTFCFFERGTRKVTISQSDCVGKSTSNEGHSRRSEIRFVQEFSAHFPMRIQRLIQLPT